ncbi:MAG: T9SS type A sorting domain-containing protein [Flavobacteriales bacterium]|nr:T9SS type A sorting domain-containing protein [Flavobacteriales bacterium]
MKLIIFIFLIALSSSLVGAQNVNIPDINFKSYLVGNPDINTNADDEIQVSEAESYTGDIIVMELSISDLTGIEAFSSIRYLNCYDNNIESIDLSNNTALVALECHYNSITNLDLSNNNLLTLVNCRYNKLTNINLSKNELLTALYCQANSLTNIDIQNNTELTTLWCQDNSLSNLITNNNFLLDVLWCQNNELSYLNLTNNTMLTYLKCANNQLTKLDLSVHPQLDFLNCDSNNLSILDVKNGNNENVTFFSAKYNDLECVNVDEEIWATKYWSIDTDEEVVFSEDCWLSVNDHSKVNSITTLNKTIIIKGRGRARVFNQMGQLITTTDVNGEASIKLSKSGIYLIQVHSNGNSISRKVYLN